MPTTIKFGKKFARSPYKAIRKHMRIVSESAAFLPDAMRACFRKDRQALEEIRQSVSELATDSDTLLEELQRHLPDASGLALERRDLFELLELQDAIADRMQKSTALLLDLPMDVPGDMHQPLLRLIDRCIAATEVACEIVKSMEKVVEAGFKGVHVEAVRHLVQDVAAIEAEADAICSDIIRLLFAQCREMDPVVVLFLYQLVGWIGDLAKASGKLAIRSQLMLVR